MVRFLVCLQVVRPSPLITNVRGEGRTDCRYTGSLRGLLAGSWRAGCDTDSNCGFISAVLAGSGARRDRGFPAPVFAGSMRAGFSTNISGGF